MEKKVLTLLRETMDMVTIKEGTLTKIKKHKKILIEIMGINMLRRRNINTRDQRMKIEAIKQSTFKIKIKTMPKITKLKRKLHLI